MPLVARPSLRGIARAFSLAAALALGAGVLAAPPAGAQPQQTIVQVAQGNPQFSTLVRAVQAAGLADTLSGPGPFTVFAPTNDAFNKLPAGTLDSLLQDREQLRAVLTYHVVSGRVTSADLPSRQSAPSVQGAPLTFSVNPPRVNNATIVQADVQASNGVIHAIDAVLLPPGAGAPAPAQLPRAGEADQASAPITLGLAGLALLGLGGLMFVRRPAPARSRSR
jgi:transforming growth factor-beta-induced protein